MSTTKIDSFRGEYRWLSNFWPVDVQLDGMTFPSVEHGYVAAKTTDLARRADVQVCGSPGAAKRLGRYMPLRHDWGAVRLPVMRDLLWQKFSHQDLRMRLMSTGDAVLVEGNTWGDTFWGVCNGLGENHLGELLMEIRDCLRIAY